MNKKKYDGYMYDGPYVETIKEIIELTVGKHPDRNAYMFKHKHGEPFDAVTFREFDDMRKALGTELVDLGLKGSNISVIGDNSHRWALTYFTVVCGVGAIVPIDRNLETGEIANLLRRSDAEAVFVTPKTAPKVREALTEVDNVKYMVIMCEPGENVSKYMEPIAVKAAEGDEQSAEDENLSAANAEPVRIMLQQDLIEKGRILINGGRREYIDAVIEPTDLSTILFTSGTTGLAKGVMLSHMNIALNVYNMSKYFHLPDGGRALSVLPMHHAYEMSCTIITAFYQAATTVICEGLKYIQQNFLEAKCGVMLGVPLIFENIYRKMWTRVEKSGESEKLSRAIALSKSMGLKNNKMVTRRMFKAMHDLFGKDLYQFIVGGAAVDPKVLIDFEAMGLPMFQGYGMTECSPIIAMNSDRYGKAASAGKPMPGTEVRIIDKDETGVGEVICKGPSVMMGYYKDPESTAAAISDGWLHTGDYGYFDEDGFLFITGRKKNVIVTKGGKNIFPEEVEYYLLSEPSIKEVIVYGKHDEFKDDLICTAIIYPDFNLLEAEKYKSDEKIYERIRKEVDKANEKMPPYKRVKRIEIRDKDFIKTTTLKIKRFEEGNYEYKIDDQTFADRKRVSKH
jgi:long-chain acyl-CoA synthetase